MDDDTWAPLAERFVAEEYASVKGRVRTYVVHQQLMAHLPAPPARILDVGGGAGNQSFPLARLGYDVTLVDSSPAMLAKAQQRLAAETAEVRQRVRFIHGDGADSTATGDQLFTTALCHGVLMYLDSPDSLVASLCERTAPGGLVSLLALNASTLAVRPALQQRWADALAAFDATGERGVLGVDTRADTVAELSELLLAQDVEPLNWYGVWLFSDWMELSASGPAEVAAVADVELEAGRRDPYRQLSRVFHLIGRRAERHDSR